MFIILFILWILQIVAVFGVNTAAILASKDTYVTNNNILTTKSGAIVQTGVYDMCVSREGVFSQRNKDGACLSPTDEQNSPAIATSKSTVKAELSSSLSDEELRELTAIEVVSPTGTVVFLNVNGFIHPDSDHLTLLTQIGNYLMPCLYKYHSIRNS